jgi:hypothetical protein
MTDLEAAAVVPDEADALAPTTAPAAELPAEAELPLRLVGVETKGGAARLDFRTSAAWAARVRGAGGCGGGRLISAECRPGPSAG